MIVVGVLAGAAIFAAIWVAGITIVFWAVEGRESVNAFTDGGNFLSQYPIDVYAKWLQSFVTFVVPIAFVAYFPAATSSTSPIRSAHPTGCRSPRRRWRSSRLSARATCGALPCATTAAREARWRRSSWSTSRRRSSCAASEAAFCGSAPSCSAVGDISFEIEAGSLVGYIGPNGAGKSTTVKMLTGILVPSSGTDLRRRLRALSTAHPVRAPHRRDVRAAHPALVGPAARRLVRALASHLQGARGAPPEPTSAASASCSTLTSSCRFPYGSSHSASASAAS